MSDSAVLSQSLSMDRRLRRWVDPQFQKRYALLLLSLVLLVSAILIGTFWYHSEQVLVTLMNAGVLKEHPLYLLISKQMSALLISVCVVVALFSAFVFLMATFLSHRIVGPIFAIKRSLECIGRGDLGEARIKLRADDEFQDVGEMINRVVDQLQKK